MWVKPCHKPPIWEWFTPPVKMVIWGMVYYWFTHIGWFEISFPFNFLAFAIAATLPGDDWLRNAVGQIPNLSLGFVGMAGTWT